jgi:Zn-finger nucleic acid-binding protein
MNCIRCQAPMKNTFDKEANSNVDFCISCRGLWFKQSDVLSALGLKTLGTATASDKIGFKCPQCPSSDLLNHRQQGLRMAIISCPKCHGAWIDGGHFPKLKQAVKDAFGQATKANPDSPNLALHIPVNNVSSSSSSSKTPVLLGLLALLILAAGAAFYFYSRR